MNHRLSRCFVAYLTAAYASSSAVFGAQTVDSIGATHPAFKAAPTPIPSLQPQPSNVEPGPPVDPSFRHGAFDGQAPMMYPANLGANRAGRLVSERAVLSSVGLDPARISADGLKLRSISLRRWARVQDERRGFGLAGISPDRLVYEVVATFDAPYTVHGNTYSTGSRVLVIDAETGTSLLGQTGGHLIHSAHQDEMRAMQHRT